MIIELLLGLIKNVLSILLTPIQLVLQPLGSAAGFIELIALASIFIPIGTFTICLGVWLSVYGFKFVITIINWLIGKIPTIS